MYCTAYVCVCARSEFRVLACSAGVSSPDVGEHQHEWTDDDSLKDLPITAQHRHARHQQLATQHHEVCHHRHGETPAGQAKLNP